MMFSFGLDAEFVGSEERHFFDGRHAHGHHVLVEVRLKFGSVGW